MDTLLLEVTVRAALIAAGTACVLRALRIRTAALRHAAWTTVLIVMLLLPFWSVAGPKIRLAVLPTIAASPEADPSASRDPGNVAPELSVTQPGPAPIAGTAPTLGGSALAALVLAAVYLLGALALLTRLSIGTVQAHLLRRGAEMREGRATSARCATPITVGFLSPVLILPEGWERWPPAHLEAILTHEREHARRHDPLVQWLALLNRAIFWFHPLAWWLERRLAVLAEEACDAAVIRAGHSPQDYSACLIDMARALRLQGRRLNVAGMAMPGSGLPDRMRHIFEELPMARLSRTRILCTLAFCAASSIVLAAGVLAPRPSAVLDLQAPAGPQAKSDIALLEPRPAEPPTPPDRVAASVVRSEGETPSKPVDPAPSGTIAQAPGIVEPPAVDSTMRAQSGQSGSAGTDFSGTWTWVSSTYAGRGRGGSGEASGQVRQVRTTYASGAPVNCGINCTIVQDANTLTISGAVYPAGMPPVDAGVVLNLDGRDSTVGPSRSIGSIAKANWDGAKLVVTSELTHSLTVTQTLSIEDGRLTVVTDFGFGDAPVTMIYVKG